MNGKVSSVFVGQNKIDPNRDYSFSTNSYVSAGGDKLTTILKAKSLKTGPLTIDELFTHYVSKKKLIEAQAEGRIKLKDPVDP